MTTENKPEENDGPELEESAHQVQPKAFWYKFTDVEGVEHSITVVATCATTAKEGLKYQYGQDVHFEWVGNSDLIMQVNGEIIL